MFNRGYWITIRLKICASMVCRQALAAFYRTKKKANRLLHHYVSLFRTSTLTTMGLCQTNRSPCACTVQLSSLWIYCWNCIIAIWQSCIGNNNKSCCNVVVFFFSFRISHHEYARDKRLRKLSVVQHRLKIIMITVNLFEGWKWNNDNKKYHIVNISNEKVAEKRVYFQCSKRLGRCSATLMVGYLCCKSYYMCAGCRLCNYCHCMHHCIVVATAEFLPPAIFTRIFRRLSFDCFIELPTTQSLIWFHCCGNRFWCAKHKKR